MHGTICPSVVVAAMAFVLSGCGDSGLTELVGDGVEADRRAVSEVCEPPSGWDCDQHCNCWPKSERDDFDCDGDGDCSSGCFCGNANCAWESWLSKDDCCICPTSGDCNQPTGWHCNAACTACWPASESGQFDCDSNSDCGTGMLCGNANCAWASGGSQDDCCIVHAAEACGCSGGGCWPHVGFDCDSDSDCQSNPQMAAIGAFTCGDGNCPWTSGLTSSQDDCCMRTGCTGEAFEHPAQTREISIPDGYYNIVADADGGIHVSIDQITLLNSPTDGFGDFVGINTGDEITLRVSDGEKSMTTPQREFRDCDSWKHVDSMHFETKPSELEFRLIEHDDSVDEEATQFLDEGLLLTLPLGSSTRLRFFLDNRQEWWDDALLWAADKGLFEVCLSDVVALATSGGVLSGAVAAAKAAKLSVKAVKGISKAVRGIKKAKKWNKHYEKRWKKFKKKMEKGQELFLRAEEMLTGEPASDPLTIPDWPTVDTAMEAAGLEPCVDFADGVVYPYTVYEVKISIHEDSPEQSSPQFINGAMHSGGPEKCPSDSQTHSSGGYTCQKWTDQHPHAHDYTPADFPDLGDHNYCRHAGEEYLWCYTTDPDTRWDYCDM